MASRDHLLNMIVDKEFFETVDRYRYRPVDYVEPLTQLIPGDWETGQNGIWFYCSPPRVRIPDQGWKLHFSTTPSGSLSLLERVTPILVATVTPFKFLVDRDIVRLSNGKSWRRGAAGKFITMYPTNRHKFLDLADELRTATANFDGPYILSDRRVPHSTVLHYRYGSLKRSSQLDVTGVRTPIYRDPDGRPVPDKREPYFTLPSWETDPYDVPEENVASVSLKGGRYRVLSSFAFRNSGGVYLADDVHTDTQVVIKEARPHVYSGGTQSSTDLLKKEHRLLSRFSEDGILPRPLDIFKDWEHTFLVQEHIAGRTLGQYCARRSPLLMSQPGTMRLATYIQQTKSIFASLARALKTMHDSDVVMADLSLSNVLVDTDTLTVKLIDLESSFEKGADEPIYLMTPQFAAPEQRSRGSITEAADRYAFGALLLAFLCPSAGATRLNPAALELLLREITIDLELPRSVPDLVEMLMAETPSRRPPWQTIMSVLESDDERPIPPVRSEVGKTWTTASVDRICDYVISTADFSRRDRLFPADSRVFSTNPLSLAYGACGIAYVLHKLVGDCPAAVLRWIASQRLDPRGYPPGLYVGLSGIAWMMYEIGLTEQSRQAMNSAMEHPLAEDCCDLFYGMAGICLAALRFFVWTGDEYYLEGAMRMARELAARSRREGDGVYWPNGDDVWVGLGRGASGVALPLLYLALLSRDDEWLRLGEQALRFEHANALTTVNDRCLWPDKKGNDSIGYPYWSVGAAGVGCVTGRYSRVTGDRTFRGMVDRIASEINRKWAVYPNFSTGLAGIGQFHLDMYDIAGDYRYVEMARRAASGIALCAIQKPAGIAFPGDRLARISCDVATGAAGVALFLGRLTGKTDGFLNLDFLITSRGERLATAGEGLQNQLSD